MKLWRKKPIDTNNASDTSDFDTDDTGIENLTVDSTTIDDMNLTDSNFLDSYDNSMQYDADPENIGDGEQYDENGNPLPNVDEKTQKDLIDNPVDAETLDDMPSANESERDSGNSKKAKLAIGAVAGTLLILGGIGITAGRMQKNAEEQKQVEAQQAAQDQKQMANGSEIKLDTEAELQELPPPSDATAVMTDDPMAANSNAPVNNAPPPRLYSDPVEPVAPYPAPAPRNSDSGGLVAGRDYYTAPPTTQPSATSTIPVEEPMSGRNGGNQSAMFSPQSTPVPLPPIKGADSGVMVSVGGQGSGDAVMATQGNGGGRNGRNRSNLGDSLTPTVLADTQAYKRGNGTMLLTKGTTIPCVLKTRIDSTYQGFTMCQVSKDVYSSNGKTLLIERGSTVFGEQNIQLNQGQARVSILWSKIDTPKGVTINIDSPATGGLGQMGIDAKVNTHFWKRFGNSIMLSVIQDGIAAASKRLEGDKKDGNDNSTNVNNTSTTVEGMAEQALKNSINIPPTATIKQGKVINILVARDVDFSSVYKLKRIN